MLRILAAAAADLIFIGCTVAESIGYLLTDYVRKDPPLTPRTPPPST